MWYNEVMFNRVMLLVSLALMIVLLAMMNFTTPMEVGPLGVLLFFTTIYVIVYGIVTWLVQIVYRMNKKKMGRKGRFYAAVISFAPIMLLLVRSFGSLSILTGVLVLVFVGLGCFLVKKLV